MLNSIKLFFRENLGRIIFVLWMASITYDTTDHSYEIHKLTNYANHLNDRINQIEWGRK